MSAGTTGRIILPAGPSRMILALPEGLTEFSVCAIAFNKLIPMSSLLTYSPVRPSDVP